MILYDFQCRFCDIQFESFAEMDETKVPCGCGMCAERIISGGTANTMPVNCDWIASIREVVDKSGSKPHCNEFLKHPTRANYKAWKKGEGLRHFERGEKAIEDPWKPDAGFKRKMARKHIERNAVSIGGI